MPDRPVARSTHAVAPEGLPIHYQPATRSRRFWWGAALGAIALHGLALWSLGRSGAQAGPAAGPLPVVRVTLPAAGSSATATGPNSPNNPANPVAGNPASAAANPAAPGAPPANPAAGQPLRPLAPLRQVDPGQLQGSGPGAASQPRWPGEPTGGAPVPDRPFNPDPIDPNLPPDYAAPGWQNAPPNRPIAPNPAPNGTGPNPNSPPAPNAGNSGGPSTNPNPGQGGNQAFGLAIVGLELTTPGDGSPIVQAADLSRLPQLQSAPPSLNLRDYPELANWADRAVDLRLAVMADGSVGFAGLLTPGLSTTTQQALEARAALLRFLPALTATGQPIAIYLRLTMRLSPKV